MRSLVNTPYGLVPVTCMPGTVTDSWSARLDDVPVALEQGGPTRATGATCALAIAVLRVAIECFEESRCECDAADGDPGTPAIAYQDDDGKWILDVPTEGVSAIGPTLDRTIAMATELVPDEQGALAVRFRERRRAS